MPIAIQKANKLVNRDKVFFLIASIGTPMNNAIFPMLEKKNVPNLFPYTAARSMYEPHHKLKFANLAPYYGKAFRAISIHLAARLSVSDLKNTSVLMNRSCFKFRMENGFLQPGRKKFSVTNKIKTRRLSPS